MSYILDALKKADHERERELSAVPGLHAQADGTSERAGAMPWRIVALGALVLLAACIAWLVLGRSEKEPPVVQAAAPERAPSPPAPTAMPSAAPAQAPTPAPPPAAAMQAPTPSPIPAPATQVAPPAPSPPPVAAPRPPPAAVAPRPTPVAPPAVAAAPKAAAPSAEARIPTRNELPADVRAAMPPLNISGAVYSTTPSARMLFANGMVLREGDAAGADLKVERIGPSASVLSFRGQSFQVKH